MALWTDGKQVFDDMNGEALILPSWPKGLTQCTIAKAQAIINPPPTLAQAQQQLQQQAKIALDVTDMVSIRCFKAGVSFPIAWQTYTQSLRNIANGTDTKSTSLPIQPAYPTGT